jgi:hypothetical protein
MADSETTVALSLVGAGLLLAAVGLPLTCAIGTHLSVSAVPDSGANATVTDYGNLSPPAQSAFDDAREGGAYLESAPAPFGSSALVRYRGTVYRVTPAPTVDCGRGAAPVVVALSAFLVALGSASAVID